MKLKEISSIETKVGGILQDAHIKYSSMKANVNGHPVVRFYDKRDLDIAQSKLKKQGFKIYDVETANRNLRMTVKEGLNEGKWSKIMTAVRKGDLSGPWSIVVYKNHKVIHQRLVKVKEQIPAHYEDVKKKYQGASIGIEDVSGQRVYTENIKQGKSTFKKIMESMLKEVNDDNLIAELLSKIEKIAKKYNLKNSPNYDLWRNGKIQKKFSTNPSNPTGEHIGEVYSISMTLFFSSRSYRKRELYINTTKPNRINIDQGEKIEAKLHQQVLKDILREFSKYAQTPKPQLKGLIYQDWLIPLKF